MTSKAFVASSSASSFEDMIEKDLELMWVIQDYCKRTPWIQDILSRIINKQPWKDIAILNWVFFTIGLFELGSKHFWVCAMNLAACMTLRRIIEAKRPLEYDSRLQPMTEIDPESYGFPSVESYMAVVIMGHLFLSLKSVLLLPLGIVVVFIVGFSRIYSRSRFPHQIMASWFLGFVGLISSRHCCEKMSFHTMSKHDHGLCVIFVLVCGVCNLALSMENNDSRILHVPKSEFTKVMREIVFGSSGADVAVNDDGEEGEEDDNVFVINTGEQSEQEEEKKQKNPSRLSRFSFFGGNNKSKSVDTAGDAVGEGQEKRGERITTLTSRSIITGKNGPSELTQRKVPTNIKKGRVKSDSLYFLQKNLEERESKVKSTSATDPQANPMRKPKYMYGKEDFFSSDTDMSVASRL